MTVLVEPVVTLRGAIEVPSVKGICQRGVLLGAIAEGESEIRGFGRAADTESAIGVARQLGVEVTDVAEDVVRVRGRGLRGLVAPTEPLDCGNAGTVMRLLSGILAGQDGEFTLIGDESLSSRPQERIAVPLREMGASVEATDGHAPLVVEGSQLHGIDYALPVASAQVKSAVLLAGLSAKGPTTVVEPAPTRDHTEFMLEAAGVRVRRRGSSVTVEPAATLRLDEVDVPGDFSSAAPLLAAAALIPGGDVTVHDLGLNQRRIGLLDVLERMGARVSVFNRRRSGREPVGDVQVQHDQLVATEIAAGEVPRLVDELPLIALLGSQAHGVTVVRGAGELRVKETDRLDAVAEGLRACGAHIRPSEDGWTITGVPTRIRGGRIDARGDHRIAMLGAVAGLASQTGVEIEGAETVAISFPGFFDLVDSVVKR